MKKIATALIIATLALTMHACTKSASLDATTNTTETEATTFADSAKSMNFLFGIYSDISFAFGYRRYTYSSNISAGTAEGCDEGVHRLNGPTQPFVYLFNGTMNSTLIEPFRYEWTTSYTDIRRANVFLSHIDQVPVSAALKSQAKGEARFLRAWYYSILLRNFGGIPIIGNEVYDASDIIQPARNSYEECVNYIVSECDTAATLLPTAYNTQDYGRITKGACLGLKSRTLLYAASPLFNGGSVASDPATVKVTAYPTADPSRWQKAAQAALDVINMNQYSLFEDNATAPGFGFSQVFLTRVNSEYVLPGMQGPNKTMETFATPTSRGANPTQTAPSQNLAEAFGMNNGKAITDPTSGYNPQNPFVNRDPRFNYTFVYNGSLWYSQTTGTKIPVQIFYTKNANGTLTPSTDQTLVWIAGYYWRKMMSDNTASNGGPNTDRCLPLIRYAEILLNYAEASNEAGNTSTAYEQLKLIRKRAGIIAGADGLYGLKSSMTQADMRTAIMNEREVELAYEDHRYFDVRRWKTAPINQNFTMNALQVIVSGTTTSYQIVPVNVNALHIFKDAYYLFPIMQSELSKNPKLIQNPGY